jgi:hypothetical protein
VDSNFSVIYCIATLPHFVFVNSYRFGRTCFLDTDGQVTCDCPQGYVGRRCEQCAAGYQGNPFIPGDSCTQGSVLHFTLAIIPLHNHLVYI